MSFITNGEKMKKILVVSFFLTLVGCSKDKPHEAFEGGFPSMEACIADVKLKAGRTPVVELMNDTKVAGRFNGLERTQGVWSCELKQNKTGLPFYGFYSIEKDI